MILMCNNKGIADSSIDQQHRHSPPLFLMETHSTGAAVAPPSNDDTSQRVKFLCSFSGSILPRPQDGKLRYVGGETRIVGVQRDIGYDELMAKMRELYDGAAVLKYQQPDEDLDALVTVVNDEDVVNMMEEYDKLGSAGDGFTRLRIFLFSQPENDFSSHFDGGAGAGDERESERRYVDALNNLNDGPDFRRQMGIDSSPVMSPVDDLQHYFNSLSLESGTGIQYNLRRLSIPHVGSNLQHLTMEPPWSPTVAAYYSPRPTTEFPSSPAAEEYSRQPPDHHSQFSEGNSVAWIPAAGVLPGGGGDKPAGFPGNIFHGQAESSGNNSNSGVICEYCRMAFYPSMTGGGPHQTHHLPCPDCPPPPHPHSHPHHHPLHLGSPYNDALVHERGWSVRPGDHYPVDGGVHVSSSSASSNFVHHRSHETGTEPFHDESGSRYGNIPFPYGGGESVYPGHGHGHVTGHSLWRNVQSQAHVPQSGLPRSHWEGSPRLCVGMENPSPWYDYHYGHGSSRPNSTAAAALPQDYQQPFQVEPARLGGAAEPDEKSIVAGEDKETTTEVKIADTHDSSFSEVKSVGGDNDSESISSSCSKHVDPNGDGDAEQGEKEDPLATEELIFLPEMVASAKKAALDGANDVKIKAEEEDGIAQEVAAGELELAANAHVDTELDSDSDNIDTSRIEPTKAEAEAIDKGLQTIKNDDLEEIRELGSGTYGAVFHGKWRGSDVAIKRIKASCFAGRPSERERLIADFWKEALILSSLHHPNVVSFYGIVRDGPDGSLATVTEFMINGSLKQFLQKKDRTIDRRKRLIIAMDAAFGMEYLHGKNIVHFDLKCENLLVNMRDPQRPICKIGDLGLSKVKQHTLVSGGVRGTLPWMAPELLSGKSNMVTEKIDVYSFGIVMWELLTGEEPYADLHCASIIGGIVNNTLRPQIPTWCDPEWKSLMESCWAAEPSSRPSFSEISQKLRNMAAAMNLK